MYDFSYLHVKTFSNLYSNFGSGFGPSCDVTSQEDMSDNNFLPQDVR